MSLYFFLKKGWKVSMKLYKTIPIFLSIFFGMVIFSIAATIWEENFYRFDANDTVLATETNTYVDNISVYIEQDGNMKESLVNYIEDEIHKMPEYLKNKCDSVYIISDEQMTQQDEQDEYGYTEQRQSERQTSTIYLNYELLNRSGENEIKNTIYHEFWHAFDMYVVFPYEYSSNSGMEELYKKYNHNENDDISEFFAKQGANYSLDTNGIRNKEDLYAYYEAIEKV